MIIETWIKDYFSKIEFVIHTFDENLGYMACNLLTSELSYQECGVTGVIVFEHSQVLSKKQVSKLLSYIRVYFP